MNIREVTEHITNSFHKITPYQTSGTSPRIINLLDKTKKDKTQAVEQAFFDYMKGEEIVVLLSVSISSKLFITSLSDNVKRSFQKKLADGTILGAAPLGYLNTTDEHGKRTVILDPDRAFIIKKLFEEYAKGLSSFKDLHQLAKSMGLRGKKKTECITASQIHELIQNPFYMGIMRYKGKLYPHIYPRLINESPPAYAGGIIIGQAPLVQNLRAPDTLYSVVSLPR